MRNTIRFVAIAVLALLVTSGSRSRDTVYAQAQAPTGEWITVMDVSGR